MRTLHRFAFALGLLTAILLTNAADGADEPRAPIPAGSDLEKAQATVRELFKAEFAKTKSTDRIALAAKLYQQALETKDDTAAKFALLREARDLAAKAGDAIGAVRAADEMATQFLIKSSDALSPALELLVASTNNAAIAKQIAEVLIIAADEARFAGEWDASLTILKAASAVAGKTSGLAVPERVRAKIKDTEAGRAEADRIKEFVEKLKTAPTDAVANAAVGRFLTFYQQEWDEGMPLLAKGADEKLQVAAQRDIKAATGSDDDQVAAADSWYELATSADAAIKPGIQIRAHHWYVAAFPAQSGINKTRLEKRINELQPIVDAKADKTELWKAVRRGVGDERLKKWKIIGGTNGRKPFEETPVGGGILIGFHYTTVSAGRYPHMVQPIYLTPFGEVTGTSYSTVTKGDSAKMTVKAKPGYAVGAIYVRGGNGFDAFKPIFMRITEAGVNPKDSYEGPHVGGMGGGEDTLGGDGNFIVGLHGRLDDKGTLHSISPITLMLNEPIKPPPRKKKP